ncbi:MAG TPA: MFS transporter [Ktedonobacterales bacterium]|nr:MFS transporter [Ktedonobacterales bacterium]
MKRREEAGGASGRQRPHSDDAWRILAARGLRQFAYGLLGVTLAIALSEDGFSPVAIGGLLTAALVGDFCATYLISLFADRWGRRRTLIWLALIMAATGAVYGLTRLYPALLLAAFAGTLGTSTSETAPFLPIEQAMLPQTCAPDRRTALFARYNLIASLAGALGALAAGAADLLTRAGLPRGQAFNLMFGAYAIVALAVALLVGRLTPQVEALRARSSATKDTEGATGWQAWRRLVPPLGSSRGIILRLSGLFSLDALAGALVTQSLLALYFHLRFGVSLSALAILFFGANLLSALSFLAAAPLARRFGLLNTMVFTHLPSNALLMLVALMPTFPLAGVTLLARQLLSQMDVPTRQAYTMALTPPEERTAAASVTSLARSAGSGLSPTISGALLTGPLVVLGLPLLIGGGLKVVYDLALWAVFRHVRPPDERR